MAGSLLLISISANGLGGTPQYSRHSRSIRFGGIFNVAWQDSRWTGVDQATLAISRDGGATWPDAQLVSAAPPNAPTFTVSTAVNQAG